MADLIECSLHGAVNEQQHNALINFLTTVSKEGPSFKIHSLFLTPPPSANPSSNTNPLYAGIVPTANPTIIPTNPLQPQQLKPIDLPSISPSFVFLEFHMDQAERLGIFSNFNYFPFQCPSECDTTSDTLVTLNYYGLPLLDKSNVCVRPFLASNIKGQTAKLFKRLGYTFHHEFCKEGRSFYRTNCSAEILNAETTLEMVESERGGRHYLVEIRAIDKNEEKEKLIEEVNIIGSLLSPYVELTKLNQRDLEMKISAER